MTDLELLDTLREAVDHSDQSRRNARKHYDFFYGRQLSASTLATLANRGQPARWENEYIKIASKIQGIKIQSRQEIKVIGRQIDEDRDLGHILTDILRTIPDSTDFYEQKDSADLDLMIAGFCVLAPEIVISPIKDKYGKNEKSIRVVHIPYEECFFDPYSRRTDFQDARYFHRVCWVDKQELQLRYKNLSEKIHYTVSADIDIKRGGDNQYGRERALIVYSWFREDGVIKYKIWDYNSKLTLMIGVSPYRFNRFPFAARALYRDRNQLGNYAGLFENIMPIQDSINFRLLRITNLMGSHKLLVEADAVDDWNAFVSDYSADDSVAMVNRGALSEGKIKDVSNHSEVDKLMQLVSDDRKQAEAVIGLNDEALGLAVNRMSAKAIERRQNAGMLGLQTYLEASDQLDKDLYGLCIELIQQYFDAEQVFRIVDKNKAERYFVVNERERNDQGVVSENNKPKIKNNLSIGRYDIALHTIEQSLGSSAERYEHSKEIMQILSAVDPNLAAEFLPHLLREIDSPAADPLRDLLDQKRAAQEKSAQSPQAQQVEKMEFERMQLELKSMQAKLQEMESRSILAAAKAQEALTKAKYHGDFAKAEGKK
jgi:hypothetical protein